MLEALRRPTAANAALFLVITALCWSGNMVLGRWAAGHVPPLTLSFIRWAGATVLMAGLAWRYLGPDWPTVRRHIPLLVFFGATGAGLFNALQYVALTQTTATSASIINSSGPVLIALAGYAVFGDRVGPFQAVGIAISLSGVLLVVTKGDPAAVLALDFNVGDLIMLLAMALASIYAVFMRKRPGIHALSFAFVTFAVAALVNLPLAAMEVLGGATIDVSTGSLLVMGYVVLVPSVIAYLCFNRGIQILGSTRAGTFLHLVPLFTAAMAVAFLDERPAAYHIAGFVLIVSGIWLAARAPAAAAAGQRDDQGAGS